MGSGKKLSEFLGSKRALGGSTIALVFFALIWPTLSDYVGWIRDIGEYFQGRWFSSGVLQSLCAAIWFAWVAYAWRLEIIRAIEPAALHLRAPLQLGIAPILVAQSMSLWRAHRLTIDLDLRYAGRDAITDLYDLENPSELAIASDVAVCKYLGEKGNENAKLQIFPFVRIEGHLKLVVRKANGVLDVRDFQALMANKLKVGHAKGSVHVHFLREIDEGNLKIMTSVLQSYRELIQKKVDAIALWEPHYRVFEGADDVGTLEDWQPAASPYNWYLCLVAREDFVKRNNEVFARVGATIKRACKLCALDSRKTEVIDACIPYLNQEFTGLDKNGISLLLSEGKHHFGIDGVGLRTRLAEIAKAGGDLAAGATRVVPQLWSELDE